MTAIKMGNLAGAAHGEPVHLDGGDADAHRNRLAVLAAGADALIERQIISHHGNVFQYRRTIADQGGIAHWPRQPAVLDEEGLRGREHKLAISDVHLATREIAGVKP